MQTKSKEGITRCDMHLHSRYTDFYFLFSNPGEAKFYDNLAKNVGKVVDGIADSWSKVFPNTKVNPKTERWEVGVRPGYTPRELYEKAMARGMDFFCLTDTTGIEGYSQLIRDCPKAKERTISGTETVVSIPGREYKLHLNIFGLSEEDDKTIKSFNGDYFKVARYCKNKGLPVSLNHIAPSNLEITATRQRLEKYTPDLPTILAEVDIIETRNGLAPEASNKKAEQIAVQYRKGMVGGSDSASGYVGRTWTEVSGAKTKEQFLEAIREKESRSGGEHGTVASLAAEISKLTWTYENGLYKDERIEGPLDFGKPLSPKWFGFKTIEQICKVLIPPFSRVSSSWLLKEE